MNIKVVAHKAIKTSCLFLKKHKSDIMLGAGILSSVTGTVLACRSTLKVDDILDLASCKKDEIEEVALTCPDEYTEKDKKDDLLKLKVKTAGSIVKNYLPAALFTFVGYGLIIKSHCVIEAEKRELAQEIATITASYLAYRNNVKEQLGEDADRAFLTGRKVKIETDENGEIIKKEITNDISSQRFMYVIDESSRIYDRNLSILLGEFNFAEREANDKLNNLGVMTVADVKRIFGIYTTPTSEELRYGWRKNAGTRDPKILVEFPTKGSQEYEDLINGAVDYPIIRFVPELDLINNIQNPEYVRPEPYVDYDNVKTCYQP